MITSLCFLLRRRALLLSAVFSLTLSGVVSAQETKAAEFAKLAVPEEMLEDHIESNELKGVLTKDDIWSAIAEIYPRYFDEKELDDLIAFYKTDTGKKFVTKQTVLTQEIVKATILLIQKHQGVASMEKTVAKQLAECKESARKAYDAAVKAKPFPNQDALLLGKWSGKFKDDEMESVWNYERRKDGTITIESVSLMAPEKEFEHTTDEYLWKTKGRVLYETMASDPSYVDIYILDEVTKKKIKFRSLTEDSDPSEWEADTDYPGSVELPKLPKGWKDISE